MAGPLTSTERQPVEMMGMAEQVAAELTKVERIGPLTRLIFTIPQTMYGNDQIEHVIVAKIVVPAEAVPDIAAKLLEAPAEISRQRSMTAGTIQ